MAATGKEFPEDIRPAEAPGDDHRPSSACGRTGPQQSPPQGALLLHAGVTLEAVTPPSSRKEALTVTSRYEGKVNAPGFPEGLDWLNVEQPLSLSELRGKLVILEFWTYC